MKKHIVFILGMFVFIILYSNSLFAQKGEMLGVGVNRLNNADFEDAQVLPWKLEVREDLGATAVMELTKDTAAKGKRSVKVQVTKPTGTDWHVKLRQDDRCFEKGGKYTVVFWCKGEKPRNVSVSFQLQHDPWTGFFSQKFAVDTEWKEYSLTFTPTVENFQDHWLAFQVADSDIVIWFDNMRYFLGEPKDEAGYIPKQVFEPNSQLTTKWGEIKTR